MGSLFSSHTSAVASEVLSTAAPAFGEGDGHPTSGDDGGHTTSGVDEADSSRDSSSFPVGWPAACSEVFASGLLS